MLLRFLKYTKFWIWLSFGLLALLLSLFMHREYQAAKGQVVRDIGFMFLSAVRSVEGEALNKFILKSRLEPDSLEKNLMQWEGRNGAQNRQITVIKKDMRQVLDGSDRVELEVKNEVKELYNADLKGNAAMVISLSVDHDSVGLDGRQAIELIQSQFDSAMHRSEYPLSYQLVPVADSSAQALTIGSYQDLGTGEKYIAQIADYHWQVWKKILPQFVFSIFVLLLVGLAFLSVWQLLAAEKALNISKDDLVQNISHELKTPIATLQIALEAMKQNPVKEQEYLQIARDEVSRLSFMVEKILNQSLLSTGKLQMQFATVDLLALSQSVLRVMQVQAENCGATLSFEAKGACFLTNADEVYLSGVLYNLIDNAFKYAPAPAHVQVGLEQKNGQLIWTVTDSGPGIPKEYAEQVFDKFFRIPKGLVHEVKGHGLGLTYCAEVVRLHQGSITIDKNQIQILLHEADPHTLS